MNATATHPSTPVNHEGLQTVPGSQHAPAAPADPNTTRAFTITSFVLGIASVVSGWTFFVPIVGLIFGIVSLRRQTTERTLALWGVWLNAAMLALSALLVLVIVVAAAFGLFALPFTA